MKKSAANTCPGCGKHCPAGAVRCKYGQKYFARLNASADQSPVKKTSPVSKPRKWEKNVCSGGLLWHFLSTGRRVKKTLRKGRATEDQILAMLTETEKSSLAAILEKIRPQCTEA